VPRCKPTIRVVDVTLVDDGGSLGRCWFGVFCWRYCIGEIFLSASDVGLMFGFVESYRLTSDGSSSAYWSNLIGVSCDLTLSAENPTDL
jgi:hypothetical protein